MRRAFAFAHQTSGDVAVHSFVLSLEFDDLESALAHNDCMVTCDDQPRDSRWPIAFQGVPLGLPTVSIGAWNGPHACRRQIAIRRWSVQ